MFYTPRFSYMMLKTVICACSRGTRMVLVGGATRAVLGGYQVGYGDWVGRGGVYRYQGPTRQAPRPDSGAGPGTPCRGWSGWSGLGAPPGSRHARTHPFGARSPCRLPGAPRASEPRLLANKGEIHLILLET